LKNLTDHNNTVMILKNEGKSTQQGQRSPYLTFY